MKTIAKTVSVMMILLSSLIFAQDRTTVSANSIDISDNLDLRAVASLFGESRDLEEFEFKLNDPNIQISNLDLNGDNQVDYLRVIESVEGRTHLIIIQSVLGRDVFQDVATIEVEKDNRNQVVVQVVGNSFIYGNNYIYEPVFFHNPIIFNNFWVHNYRPYWSTWHWGFYPNYFYAWSPFPIFRYRNNINVFINYNNTCNYVPNRRSTRAVAMYNTRGRNDFGRQNPTRSFANRNENVNNRYELTQIRETRGTVRNNADGTVRSNSNTRGELADNGISTPRNATSSTRDYSPRNSNAANNSTPRSSYSSANVTTPRAASSSSYSAPRSSYSSANVTTPRAASSSSYSTPRSSSSSANVTTPRAASSSSYSTPRSSSSSANVTTPRAASSSSYSAPRSSSSSSNVTTPRAASSSSYSAPRSSSSSSNVSTPRAASSSSYSAPRSSSSSSNVSNGTRSSSSSSVRTSGSSNSGSTRGNSTRANSRG